MRYKIIFWDFDGVILDSMKIRTAGFRKLFSDYPNEAIDNLIDYHLKNGGLSRYVKISYFFNEIMVSGINDEQVNIWAKKYSDIVTEDLVSPKLFINDSLSFIKEEHQNFTFHIVSGSDGVELRSVCKQLGIDVFFKSINGSPTPKSELIKSIINTEDYSRNDCCMIGDSINDFDAAESNGITFFAYNNIDLKKITNNYISSFNNWI